MGAVSNVYIFFVGASSLHSFGPESRLETHGQTTPPPPPSSSPSQHAPRTQAHSTHMNQFLVLRMCFVRVRMRNAGARVSQYSLRDEERRGARSDRCYKVTRPLYYRHLIIIINATHKHRHARTHDSRGAIALAVNICIWCMNRNNTAHRLSAAYTTLHIHIMHTPSALPVQPPNHTNTHTQRKHTNEMLLCTSSTATTVVAAVFAGRRAAGFAAHERVLLLSGAREQQHDRCAQRNL